MFRLVAIICWICVANANPTDQVARSIKPRIIGGKIIDIEDAPYQVAVLDMAEGGLCGGSIIASQYIVTAGHCADSPARYYQVISGSDYYSRGNVHKVSKVIRHKGYSLNWDGIPVNDIAVMKLTKPFKLDGKTEKIVELFEQDEKAETGDSGFVSGWGLTDSGSASSRLRGLTVKMVSKSVCTRNYRSLGGPMKKQICATSPTGTRDFCNGDSGGPLVVDGRLAGLVSWSGPGCAIRGRPGVYTEVAAYRDWIDEQIEA